MAVSVVSVPSGHDRSGGAGVLTEPVFVGRERELAALARAVAGPAAVIVVEGEAGIGKSRLVRALLGSLPVDRVSVPVATCPPFRGSLTLGPIVDAVREAVGDVAGLSLSGLAGALRPVFPEWAEALPPAPESLQDPAAARHRLYRAFAELLDRLGSGLLVVEDAHWADEATLEFLLFLVTRASPGPSLLVTYRPEDLPVDSLLNRLSARPRLGTVRLRLPVEPLGLADTARLASSMLPGERLAGELVDFLHHRTDGVPLAVEELLRLMYDRAELTRRDGEWTRRTSGEVHIPPTIRDAVLERAGRLGQTARAVLWAAAVLTDPADEPTLAALAELPVAQARVGLAEALGSGLLSEDARGRVVFRHVLKRLAIYESIPGPHRRSLHLNAARMLSAVTPPPVAHLARHFREAGDTAAWARYAELSAELAMASGEEVTAVAVLHELITGADLPAGTVVRLAGRTLIALDGESRLQSLIEALRRALGAPDAVGEVRGQLRFELGRACNVMDDYDAGRVEFERALPDLAGDPLRAAQAMVLLGWPRGGSWPAARHRRWLYRAMRVTASLPPADRAPLAAEAAAGLLLLGDRDGWAHAARLPAVGTGAREYWAIASAHTNLGDLAIRWGRYGEARRRLSIARDMTDTYQYVRCHEVAAMNLLHLDLLTGAWDGLAERVGAWVDRDTSQRGTRLEASLVLTLLRAATADGDVEEALENIVASMARLGMLESYTEPAAALAALQLAQGRVEDALRSTEEPMAMVAAKGIWLWATELAPARVEALLAAGHEDEAADLVTAFARGVPDGDAPAPLAGLATCRALLVEAGGDPGPAAAGLARAAAAWNRLPRPYEALRARERQARCLLAAGRREAGLALLTRVFDGLAELGARAPATRVLHALREHGVLVRRPWWGGPRRSYGDDLSPREREVARLVSAGRSNREVAEVLFLSPKTVARHLGSAMRKLDVSSRTALAVRVVEAGLVPTDGTHGR